ncbi:MAG: class I SAM-dependent methyltransferase [Opitutae bacterium]|nr:class I SAM-dependent methyltransferase [Opitutae bacterium]
MEQIVYTDQKVPVLLVPLMYREVLKERPSTFLYEAVQQRIEADRAAIDAFLAEIRPFCYHAKFDRIARNNPAPGEPFLENKWFTGGDARAAYGIPAAKRPKRIVEIGSGNSTMFMKRAIRDFSLATQLTSIDPAPRAEIDALCNTVIRRSVLDVDLAVFRQLNEGDILFHDGSHVTFNGSDTVRLFLEILPLLRPGVLIHIHDICLPYEYIEEFNGRGYSEQYMLATALLYSRDFEVILPVSYLGRQKAFEAGGSFWMRKK